MTKKVITLSLSDLKDLGIIPRKDKKEREDLEERKFMLMQEQGQL